MAITLCDKQKKQLLYAILVSFLLSFSDYYHLISFYYSNYQKIENITLMDLIIQTFSQLLSSYGIFYLLMSVDNVYPYCSKRFLPWSSYSR